MENVLKITMVFTLLDLTENIREKTGARLYNLNSFVSFATSVEREIVTQTDTGAFPEIGPTFETINHAGSHPELLRTHLNIVLNIPCIVSNQISLVAVLVNLRKSDGEENLAVLP